MTIQHKVEKTFCTTREAAQMLGVSLRTAQLWAESGLLEAWKTGGGHRRITRNSIDRLLSNPATRGRSTAPEWLASNDIAPSLILTEEPAATLSILIVEDEATLRRVYELNLASWPMQPRVDTAADGYEALILMGHTKPDLLITDLRMPGMDGFRMIHAIRRVPELASMAIVVVTGLAPEEIEERSGIPDGITVLPKPIPFDTLREIAEGVLAAKYRVTESSS